MKHRTWRRARIIAAVATVSLGLMAAAVAPAVAQEGDVQLAVDLRDAHLRCDGDSARIVVTATRDGEPAAGVMVTVIVGATSEHTELGPTNAHGRASGRITPEAGTAAHFVYIVGESSEGPERHMGACPFVPGADTVDYSGRFVDEDGHPVRGERVSAEITGPTFGSVVPPHWTRSERDGGFSWQGIPSWWESDAFDGSPRRICLAESSRYEIASVNGIPIASGADRCVRGVPLDELPAAFGLRRK